MYHKILYTLVFLIFSSASFAEISKEETAEYSNYIDAINLTLDANQGLVSSVLEDYATNNRLSFKSIAKGLGSAFSLGPRNIYRLYKSKEVFKNAEFQKLFIKKSKVFDFITEFTNNENNLKYLAGTLANFGFDLFKEDNLLDYKNLELFAPIIKNKEYQNTFKESVLEYLNSTENIDIKNTKFVNSILNKIKDLDLKDSVFNVLSQMAEKNQSNIAKLISNYVSEVLGNTQVEKIVEKFPQALDVLKEIKISELQDIYNFINNYKNKSDINFQLDLVIKLLELSKNNQKIMAFLTSNTDLFVDIINAVLQYQSRELKHKNSAMMGALADSAGKKAIGLFEEDFAEKSNANNQPEIAQESLDLLFAIINQQDKLIEIIENYKNKDNNGAVKALFNLLTIIKNDLKKSEKNLEDLLLYVVEAYDNEQISKQRITFDLTLEDEKNLIKGLLPLLFNKVDLLLPVYEKIVAKDYLSAAEILLEKPDEDIKNYLEKNVTILTKIINSQEALTKLGITGNKAIEIVKPLISLETLVFLKDNIKKMANLANSNNYIDLAAKFFELLENNHKLCKALKEQEIEKIIEAVIKNTPAAHPYLAVINFKDIATLALDKPKDIKEFLLALNKGFSIDTIRKLYKVAANKEVISNIWNASRLYLNLFNNQEGNKFIAKLLTNKNCSGKIFENLVQCNIAEIAANTNDELYGKIIDKTKIFSYITIANTNFFNDIFSDELFVGTKFNNVSFKNSYLANVSFVNATFNNVSFEDAFIDGNTFKTINKSQLKNINLANAKFIGDFSDADLAGLDLSNIDLSLVTSLTNADLENTILPSESIKLPTKEVLIESNIEKAKNYTVIVKNLNLSIQRSINIAKSSAIIAKLNSKLYDKGLQISRYVRHLIAHEFYNNNMSTTFLQHYFKSYIDNDNKNIANFPLKDEDFKTWGDLFKANALMDMLYTIELNIAEEKAKPENERTIKDSYKYAKKYLAFNFLADVISQELFKNDIKKSLELRKYFLKLVHEDIDIKNIFQKQNIQKIIEGRLKSQNFRKRFGISNTMWISTAINNIVNIISPYFTK
jgi:uncharacterized protein YjbI with pentapeptide repeats